MLIGYVRRWRRRRGQRLPRPRLRRPRRPAGTFALSKAPGVAGLEAAMAHRAASVSRPVPQTTHNLGCKAGRTCRTCDGRDRVEEAFRNIEAPEVLEAIQQPVGVCGIAARLELPEPDEPRHAGVGRLFEQMLEVAPKPGRPAGRRRAVRSSSWPAGMVRVCRQASTNLRTTSSFAAPAPLLRGAGLRAHAPLIGYARVSKTDGSQSLNPQRDARPPP